MKVNWERILAGKRALRQKLAQRPLTEKLRMLDDLRERALDIRRAAHVVRERPAHYQSR